MNLVIHTNVGGLVVQSVVSFADGKMSRADAVGMRGVYIHVAVR